MKWLHAIRVKFLGGPPTGPQTTDEQHVADDLKADLLQKDADRRDNPPDDPHSLES